MMMQGHWWHPSTLLVVLVASVGLALSTRLKMLPELFLDDPQCLGLAPGSGLFLE